MKAKTKRLKEQQANRRKPKGSAQPTNPYDGAEVEIRDEVDVDEFLRMMGSR